jgi:hypothetical protein
MGKNVTRFLPPTFPFRLLTSDFPPAQPRRVTVFPSQARHSDPNKLYGRLFRQSHNNLRRVLGEKSPCRPVVTYLSFDREQRKKTRLSWVESLIGTFTLRAHFKNGWPHKSEDNANQ